MFFLGLDERNYDERVGEGYHMRSLARSTLTRALNRLSSESSRRAGSLGHHQIGPSVGNGSGHHSSQNLHRTSSRLSRVHNQLVSQMRATFRAMEMSPDLAQRGKSPLANAKAKASQEVMEKTQKNAVTVNKANFSNTKQELRALSQRLERMLKERREASNAGSPLETPRFVDFFSPFLVMSNRSWTILEWSKM